MIPLGDSEAARRLSPVNTILIAGNIGIFGLELWDSNALLLTCFALVPVCESRTFNGPGRTLLRRHY